MGKRVRILGTRAHMTLFGEETATDVAGSSGRDAELNELRNMHILYRYEWYARDRKLAYDWVVAQVAREFYLKPFTISWVINNNLGVVARANKEGLSGEELRERFPWW